MLTSAVADDMSTLGSVEGDSHSCKDGNTDAANRKKKVGNYLLMKTIGEGAFAKIRQGLHIIAREKVAVKIVSKKAVLLRDYVKRNVRREAIMLQKLEHPNIVRLYEIMETEHSYYLVMELADTGEFIKYLSEKKYLDENECRKYIRQISSALDHMHTSNIVHRDLKLENLLLDRCSNIKIVDFGFSNVFYGATSMNTQCGSPVYAAPEIFCNKKYGPAVDIWSMGVCMYAMLEGKLPFIPTTMNNLTQLQSMILKGIKPPSGITEGCRDLLSRMLTVDVFQRITMDDILIHPWLSEGYETPLVTRQPPIGKLFPNVPKPIIVNYMTTVFNFNEDDIFYSVIERKMNAMAATYHLLQRRYDAGLQLVGLHLTAGVNDNDSNPKKGGNSIGDIRYKTGLPTLQGTSVHSSIESHKSIDNKGSAQQFMNKGKTTGVRTMNFKELSIRRNKTRRVMTKHTTKTEEETKVVPDFILTYAQTEPVPNGRRYEWEQTFVITKQELKRHERSETIHHGTSSNKDADGRGDDQNKNDNSSHSDSTGHHGSAYLRQSMPSKAELSLNLSDKMEERERTDCTIKTTSVDDPCNETAWSAFNRQKSRLARGVTMSSTKSRSNVAYGVSISAPKALTPREAKALSDELGRAQVVGQGRPLLERAKFTKEDIRTMWTRKARTATGPRGFPEILSSAQVRPRTQEIGYRTVDTNGILQFPDVLPQPEKPPTPPKHTVVDGVLDVIKVHITSSVKQS